MITIKEITQWSGGWSLLDLSEELPMGLKTNQLEHTTISGKVYEAALPTHMGFATIGIHADAEEIKSLIGEQVHFAA